LGPSAHGLVRRWSLTGHFLNLYYPPPPRSSFAAFKEKFTGAGAPGPAFGSGWIWLVAKDGKLAIEFTKDAQNPLAGGSGTPLITYDVWVRGQPTTTPPPPMAPPSTAMQCESYNGGSSRAVS
jgi:hypothetical protein